LITINILVLSVAGKQHATNVFGRVAIAFIAPFQELVTRSMRAAGNVWRHYFFLIGVSQENDQLKRELDRALEKNTRIEEVELANQRLRQLLNFKQTDQLTVLPAEVISRDPSAWFKTVIINKGRADGLRKGLPVVLPKGVTGQVVDVSERYAKIMLIIDRNSAVDGLIQRTRARGVIKGASADHCYFEYVLRKHDVQIGDTVISSGLDGVYPKGLRIGEVAEVSNREADIFKEITVRPYVDFEKLEEVLVILNPPAKEAVPTR
jgi:rod shape-determining protein MreC